MSKEDWDKLFEWPETTATSDTTKDVGAATATATATSGPSVTLPSGPLVTLPPIVADSKVGAAWSDEEIGRLSQYITKKSGYSPSVVAGLVQSMSKKEDLRSLILHSNQREFEAACELYLLVWNNINYGIVTTPRPQIPVYCTQDDKEDFEFVVTCAPSDTAESRVRRDMLKSVGFHVNGMPIESGMCNSESLACWRPVVRDRVPDKDHYGNANQCWPTVKNLLEDKRVQQWYFNYCCDKCRNPNEMNLYIINVWGDLYHVHISKPITLFLALHAFPMSISSRRDDDPNLLPYLKNKILLS